MRVQKRNVNGLFIIVMFVVIILSEIIFMDATGEIHYAICHVLHECSKHTPQDIKPYIFLLHI